MPGVASCRAPAHTVKSAGRAGKPLVDLVVVEGLRAAARQGLPTQFHTGFGDPDLDLRLANPLHLRPVLEDPELKHARLVLLHASYPYAREAGYLAAMYPQVFVDYGLAVPCLSVAGMRRALAMLLELAPTSKVLYSSDAHVVPELYHGCARGGRRGPSGGTRAAGPCGSGWAHVSSRNARRLRAADRRGRVCRLRGAGRSAASRAASRRGCAPQLPGRAPRRRRARGR